MAKKLPGEEVPDLFIGLLKHHEGMRKLKGLDLKPANSKLKAAKARPKGAYRDEN